MNLHVGFGGCGVSGLCVFAGFRFLPANFRAVAFESQSLAVRLPGRFNKNIQLDSRQILFSVC